MASPDSPSAYEFLRHPDKNELRCIARHDLGYYGYVVVAGVYQTLTKLPSPLSTPYFLPAVKDCVDTHPILSVAIKGADTQSPQFVRPSHLDLHRHIRIVDVPGVAGEEQVIREAIIQCHDRFSNGRELIPPWDVTVVPLPHDPDVDGTRLCILLSYSHSHGDGTAGLPFHRTFLRGLVQHDVTLMTQPAENAGIYESPHHSLLPAFEQAAHLKISWPYLLGAIFSDSLPSFLRTGLGLPSMSLATKNTWLGRPKSHDPAHFHTDLKILVLKSADVNQLLSACRSHEARLTGLLHQLIVRALSQTLQKLNPDKHSAPPAYDIVAQIPVNLRHLAKDWASTSDMVMAVSATQQLFPATAQEIPPDTARDMLWSGARDTGIKIGAAASTLTDQPIGLLRYVSDIRSWLTGKLGKSRDYSYELSNIMAFDPEVGAQQKSAAQGEKGWEVGNLYFSQPANVVGSPLSFSVVSRKGGDLAICLSWQVGVLGVEDEGAFARDVLASIKTQIGDIKQ